MKSKSAILSTVLCFILVGCSGGGGGSNSSASTSSCGYAVPSTDLSSFSSSDAAALMSSLGSAVYTSDDRLAFELPTGGSNFTAAIWNGSNWSEEPMITGSPYGSFYSPSLISYGNQLALAIDGNSGTARDDLYFEQSGVFQAPLIMTGISGTDLVPMALAGYSDYGKISAASNLFSAGTSYAYFIDNSTAGSFTSWDFQAVASSATDSLSPVKSGYFTDKTAYLILQDSGSNSGKLSLYRRTGLSWTDLSDFELFNPGGTGGSISNATAVEDKQRQRVYVFWTEFVPAIAPNSSELKIRATSIDLTSFSASAPVTLTTFQNPGFTNPVQVYADFFAGSTNGIYAIENTDTATAFLGTIAAGAFGPAKSYHPELTFNGPMTLKIVKCDQPVLMTKMSSSLFIGSLGTADFQ